MAARLNFLSLVNVAVVEAVGCDGATELIDHLGGDGDAAGIRGDARDALYIKGDVGGEEAAGAVVGDAEKGAAEGVEVGASWSAGVGEGEGSGALGSGVTGELAGEPGAVGDGVVGVPRFLAPDIEDDLGDRCRRGGRCGSSGRAGRNAGPG